MSRIKELLEGRPILQSYEESILFLQAMDVLVDTLKQGLESIVEELEIDNEEKHVGRMMRRARENKRVNEKKP